MISMAITEKIGLGTVQFGTFYGISNLRGQTSPQEVQKILAVARENSINLIDTASAYGNAETVLGQNNVRDFRVVSKFMKTENREIKEQLTKSLSNLQISQLYGYLAHRPLELIENKYVWHDLQMMKEKGFIQKTGISLNETFELDTLLQRGIIPDIVQVPYNYFDHRFKDKIYKLKEYGCEIHTRSAFLQGLFFCDTERISSFFNPVKKIVHNLQKEYGSNLPGMLLNYCLKTDFIDYVIIGVNNAEQLAQNIKSLHATFDFHLDDVSLQIPENILIPSKWIK